MREMVQLTNNCDNFFQPDAINVHCTSFKSLHSADATGMYLAKNITVYVEDFRVWPMYGHTR